MKRLFILVSVFLTGMLLAWEPFMSLTLQTNIADQVKYVMPHRPLHFTAVSGVEKDQPFQLEIAIIAREKSAVERKFTGSITLTDPDGKSRKILDDHPVAVIPAGGQGVFAADVQMKIAFDGNDKPGKYRFELLLKDGSGKVKNIAREIELAGSIVDDTPMDEKSFNEFLNFYYRSPKPGRFFAAWKFYLEDAVIKQQKKEGGNFNPSAALLGFCEVLKLNPQFHDRFAALTARSTAENQAFYAFICAGLGEDFLKKYEKKIHPDVMTLVKRLGDQDPFAIDEVSAPFQLDMLWLKFMVTGSFEPIKMLAGELRQRPFMELEDAKKKQAAGQRLTPEEQTRLMNRLMQFAVLWSMESNIKQGHTLAGYYLETILSRKLYSDKLEAQLIIYVLEKTSSKKGSEK